MQYGTAYISYQSLFGCYPISAGCFLFQKPNIATAGRIFSALQDPHNIRAKRKIIQF